MFFSISIVIPKEANFKKLNAFFYWSLFSEMDTNSANAKELWPCYSTNLTCPQTFPGSGGDRSAQTLHALCR